MDQAPPESKRPRLANTPSWPSNGHQLLNAPSPSPTNHSHPYSAPPSHPPYSPNTQQHGPPHHPTAPLPSLGGQHPPPPPSYTYPPPQNPYSTGRPPEPHQHPPRSAPLPHTAPPMLGPPPPPPPSQSHYPPRQEGRTPLPPHVHQQGPHPYAHAPSPQVPFNPHPAEERRHHEQDRYPRLQEHRQSNPSPVHLQPSGAGSAPPPPPLFHGYTAGQRDREPEMMVKADPGGPASGEESVNHLAHGRRPPSTGNQHPDGFAAGPGPEPGPAPPSHSGLPPSQPVPQMQQGPPPPLSHPTQDGRRHVSMDNAAQPPMYRQPLPMQTYVPSPNPVPHGGPYEYGLSYGPAGSGINYDGVVSVAQKRKAQRASQACEKCRELKAKCDEQKPCKNCKEKKLECKYRETQPKALDKGTTDIMEAILSLREEFVSRMDNLDSRMDNLDSRAARLEQAVIKSGIKLELRDEDSEGMVYGGSAPAEPALKPPSSSPKNLTPLVIPVQGEDAQYADNMDVVRGPAHDPEAVQEVARDDDIEDENPPGPPVVPEQPSIPINHTTVASMLLKWDSIRVLVQRHLDRERIKYISEFPIQQEQRRGLLRLYGRGEGSDNKFFDREASLEREPWVPPEAYDDNAYSDAGGGSSPPDCWGTTGGLSPISSATSRAGSHPRAALWDFSEDKVWTYVQSYKDNIQNMHPLIVPNRLDALVKIFLSHVEHSKTRHKSEAVVAGYVETSGSGYKRKRSPAPDGMNNSQSTPRISSGEPRIERTIHNALVLLVLALGKISLHKTSIPDPAALSASEPPSNLNSPMISHHAYSGRNGYPASAASPMQGSPPLTSHHYNSGPSPTDGFHHGTSSRRASVGASTAALPTPKPMPRQRNMEIIPGLDYFSLATDILGNQNAGHSMRHVHARILAGLYYGQLGRVMESYAEIKNASYALLLIMRPSLHRLAKIQQDKPFYRGAIQSHRDNQIIFAFWSCLQLESDIIAELPLPHSSILQYEHQIPYPNIDLAMAKDGSQNGFSSEVLMSYTTQLYLRRTLNEIHQKLYSPELENPARRESGLPPRTHPTSTVYQFLLDQLHLDFVPSMYKFDPKDPNPATDILGARLRAKYWGAQNITLRPFIRQITQFNFERSRNTTDSPAPISGGFSSDFTAPAIGPEAKSDKDIDGIIIDHAQKGIWALIQSTRSFHGLKDERFIITNVFGTAHAQWGNLLVLAAAWKDPTLNKYIKEADLQDLFVKTIKFLRTVAHQSSSLAIDMRILEGLYKDFWPNLSRNYVDTTAPNTSFSSSGSGPVSLPPMAASHTPPNAVHLPSVSNMYPGNPTR